MQPAVLACTLLLALAGASTAHASPGFAIERYALTASEQNATADTQAGSHPYELTAEVAFADATSSVKDLHFELPPGLVLDARALPQCSVSDFIAAACPNSTAIGVATATVAGTTYPAALYALAPAVGEPLRLGFTADAVPLFLDGAIRAADGGVTLSVDDVSQLPAFTGFTVSLWGDPGDPAHNPLRGPCATGEQTDCQGGMEAAFVTLPTSCAPAVQSTAVADSWQEPGVSLSDPVSFAQLTGCQRLPFAPALSVAPDVSQPDEPSGYELDLHIPQNESPGGFATSQLENASVTLPAGVSLSLSATNGLAACDEAQSQLGSSEPTRCPNASKLGTVRVRLPMLADPLEGALFLATPLANPLHALVGLYLVAEDPVAGVTFELPGELLLNATTGQATLEFDDIPQVPIEDLELHFFGGERGLLTNPPTCGPASSTATFAPWSAQEGVTANSVFEVSSPDPGGCPNPLLFQPSFSAQTVPAEADSSSSLELAVSATEDQQPLSGLRVALPAGLEWMFSTVPLCEEPDAAAGNCPRASQIGSALLTVGPGPTPTWFLGAIYLSGPSDGSPYGLSIAFHATAGPFELGTLVIGATVAQDSSTGAITITTDQGPNAIPTVLDGIPLKIGAFDININRPEFIVNPTVCESRSITAAIEGSQGATVQPSVPFTTPGCEPPVATNSNPDLPSPAPHPISKSTSKLSLSHIHERRSGHHLLLSFTTSADAAVSITGKGVRPYKHQLSAGAHRLQLTLTAPGLLSVRRHHHLHLELALTAPGAVTALAHV